MFASIAPATAGPGPPPASSNSRRASSRWPRASSPAPNGSPARNNSPASPGTPDEYAYWVRYGGSGPHSALLAPAHPVHGEPAVDASARISEARHCTGSIRPSRNTQLAAPRMEITPVITRAHTKFPVWPTVNPVTVGAATPARFPAKFCKPVHLPAARGPASVCVITHTFDVFNPYAALAINRNATARSGPAIAQAASKTPPTNCPVPIIVFRTNVALHPAAIHRSEAAPEITDTNAISRYASAPIFPMRSSENCRSRTR